MSANRSTYSKRYVIVSLSILIFSLTIVVRLTDSFGLSRKPRELQAQTSPEEASYKDLKFYQGRDPEQDLKQAIEKKDYRFKLVCDFACWAPGGQTENSYAMFVSEFGGDIVDGTGDVVYGGEHSRLKEKVKQYAAEYNRLLLKKLEEIEGVRMKNIKPVTPIDEEIEAGLD